MKHLITRYSWLLLALALLGTTIFAVILLSETPDPKLEIEPNNIYEETLIVNAARSFGPYSFIDDEGNPSGHDVELLYILADELEMNVDLRLREWADATSSIEAEEADMILALINMADPLQNVNLSIPVVSDNFIAFGTEDYGELHKLYSKNIAVLAGDDIVSLFIEPHQLTDNITTYNLYQDAFDSVASGENDYVIATYSVGRLFSENYDEIEAYGEFLVSNYSFHIGVDAANDELMEQVNAFITEKNNDGTLQKLSDKWLGSYIEIMSLSDFIQANKVSLLLVMGICILFPLLFLIYSYKNRLHISKTNESFLFERASRDFLTGLFNRSACERAIKYALIESMPKQLNALFMIDVDHFKSINDTQGHMFGDKVLMLVAHEIKTLFRDNDVVARMGGDEFIVLMKNFNSYDILHEKATELCKSLNTSKVIEGVDLTLSISVGIAVFPTDGTDFTSLYKNADIALYNAKENGKNTFALFEKSEVVHTQLDSSPID